MNKIDNQIKKALAQDGFEINTIDNKLIAHKNEVKIIVNKFNEVIKKTNYIHVLSEIPDKVNRVSKVPFLEIKKLLKYEKKNTKSLFETFQKMCDKYVWHKNNMSDYDLDQNTEIKYIEIDTDLSEIYTFVFIKDEVKEFFFVYKISSRELLNRLNNLKIVHNDLKSVAPELFKYISK